jgi:hypothetical protein
MLLFDGQAHGLFLVFTTSPGFGLSCRHAAGKTYRQKKHVKRPRKLTSSFTLPEVGRMPEVGADECHFAMYFIAYPLPSCLSDD